MVYHCFLYGKGKSIRINFTNYSAKKYVVVMSHLRFELPGNHAF